MSDQEVMDMNEGMRIVGYVRVSSAEQASSGLGLEGQRTAITGEAQRRGWELVAIYEDAAASGKSTNGRPGPRRAPGAGRCLGLCSPGSGSAGRSRYR